MQPPSFIQKSHTVGAKMSRATHYSYLCLLLLGILGVFPGGLLAAPQRARDRTTSFTSLHDGYPYADGEEAPTLDSSSSSSSSSRNDAIDRLTQLFGIKRIPPSFRHKTPPEYMSALYRSVAYDDGITKSAAPYDADVVRGFPDRASREQMHFLFNVSYVEPHEQVLEAEFQIFKLRPKTISTRHLRGVHVVQLKLFEVLENAGVRLLDHRRISAHSHGWQKFQVTDTVLGWRKNQSTNHGFLVEATSLRGDYVNGSHVRFAQRSEHHDSKQPVLVVFTQEDLEALNEDSYEDDDGGGGGGGGDVGLSSAEMDARRRNYIQFLNEGHRAQFGNVPFQKHSYMSPRQHERLTSDTSDGGGSSPSSRSRTKRSAGGATDDETDYYEKAANEHAGYKYNRKRKKSCSRDTLYVDFEEIGWSDWIISPKGYNAYHCRGDCPFPLGQNQKPTNHATVQSIVHAMRISGGKELGTPCCVPNKLFSISLLYFDDEENVTLKKYADMVAASCGCH